MLPSQELALKKSKLVERVNILNSQDVLTEENQNELSSVTDELLSVEKRWRASIAVEDVKDGEKTETTDQVLTAENREFQTVLDRVELRSYIGSIANNMQVAGAEKELQDHYKLGGDSVPWVALLPREDQIEMRASAATSAPATVGLNQHEILRRVFRQSKAVSALGVSMSSVPTGDALFTVMTAGTTGSQVAKAAEHDGTAASFSPFSLSPLRMTADYLWSVEDASRLMGLENSVKGRPLCCFSHDYGRADY